MPQARSAGSKSRGGGRAGRAAAAPRPAAPALAQADEGRSGDKRSAVPEIAEQVVTPATGPGPEAADTGTPPASSPVRTALASKPASDLFEADQAGNILPVSGTLETPKPDDASAVLTPSDPEPALTGTIDPATPPARPDARTRPILWLWWGVFVLLCLGSAWAGLVQPVVALVLALVSLVPLLLPRPRPAQEPTPVSMPEPDGRRDTRVQALVAALPEPALLLTAQGNIVTANARVALALGPAREGDPLSFVMRVPEVLEAVRAAAADGLPRRVEFAERVPLDRWLEAHVVPLHLDSGTHGATARTGSDAVLLTFRDLTHQRRVEQMRADFVANASHELRTPLASLSGFIETLQGPARNDAEARERFLGIMSVQARRMSRLIEDLLSLSRIELHVHVQPETEVDLCDILTHVCDALSPLARERGVRIEQSCLVGPLPVRGDRDELIRLLENLVENALKYGASGERVTVTMDREETQGGAVAVVSVRDYGPGIPPEHLPRLTERFYRVNVAASRGQGGTGLGLAIVKHIVARHRGRMNIESVHGEGATFTFRLDVLPDKQNLLEQQ